MMVRDELDIIECNILHHLDQGIAHVLVTDNGSVDGTRDLLADLARAAPVTVLDEAPADWRQGVWVTAMARMASDRFGATWVVNTDADEFFLATDGTVETALAAADSAIDVLRVSRNDFVAIERRGTGAPPLEMIYRKSESLNRFGSPLLAKAVHRGAGDVVVSQGCHAATSAGFGVERESDTIVTFHYPVRSLEQFESKVRNAGSGYALNRSLPPGVGSHKRRWYDLLQRGLLGPEYEEHHYFGPGRLRDALASGELVRDRRLADQLSKLRPGR